MYLARSGGSTDYYDNVVLVNCKMSSVINKADFDYIKVGPFIRHLGPLKQPTTNQRLYKKQPDGTFEDITSRFWKK